MNSPDNFDMNKKIKFKINPKSAIISSKKTYDSENSK